MGAAGAEVQFRLQRRVFEPGAVELDAFGGCIQKEAQHRLQFQRSLQQARQLQGLLQLVRRDAQMPQIGRQIGGRSQRCVLIVGIDM